MAKPKQISKEELADLKKRAGNILAFVRQQVLQKHPFVGTVSMNLELVPVRDARCSTACTDGNTVYFDIDFLSKLNQEEREFVLSHEIWHVVMMHIFRTGSRDMQLWNFATDMEVNQLLAKDGFIPPKDLIWPNSQGSHESMFNLPNDLSAEEYYDLIIKDAKKQMQQMMQQMQGQGSGGNGKGSGQGSGRRQQSPLTGQFDKHFDNSEDLDKQGEAVKNGEMKRTDKYGEVGIDEDFKPAVGRSEQQENEAVERAREAVVSAAQQVEKQHGDLPGHIKEIVKKILTPKIPWKEVLQNFITTRSSNKSNWNIPNRRFVYNGIYLPSHGGDAINVAVGIDTSGSCMNDFPRFLAEFQAIMKAFDNYKLHIVQCDTEVAKVDDYDNEEKPFDADAANYEFKGCGGTELSPIFRHLKEENTETDAVIIFTDGEFDAVDVKFDTGLPTLWVVTSNGNTSPTNYKFGEVIQMDKEDNR